MTDRVVYLKPPERKPPAVATTAPAIVVGRPYQFAEEPIGETHGLCGGLDYTTEHGRVIAMSPARPCFLWDVDEELTDEALTLRSLEEETIELTPLTKIHTSHFVISHATLTEPQILDQASRPQLTTSAHFQFVFDTTLPAVRLGVLHLVQTQCFALRKNGKQQVLRHCGEAQPVLYVTDQRSSDEVLLPILDSEVNAEPQQHDYAVSLTQAIPDMLEGTAVESLTVLEQYTTYFMQRELPFTQANIWTPVCAPVTWGWSMRVAKRQDDDWCIVRQKLLMPTVGHNGLELPVWEGNQLEC
jgi:hypothetical protein